MTGTIINTITILVGGLLGLLIGKRFSQPIQNIVMQGIGLSVLFLGGSSAIEGILESQAPPLLSILSLILGGVVGELLHLDRRIESMGDFLQSKLSKGGGSFSKAFVTSSLLYCVGSLAILGPIKERIEGDASLIFVKSILDGVTAIIFASRLGVGVLFAAVPVFLYQGTISLSAFWLSAFMTETAIREFSIVGGVLIFAIGINLLEMAKIKIENFLPSLLIPPLYFLFFPG